MSVKFSLSVLYLHEFEHIGLNSSFNQKSGTQWTGFDMEASQYRTTAEMQDAAVILRLLDLNECSESPHMPARGFR